MRVTDSQNYSGGGLCIEMTDNDLEEGTLRMEGVELRRTRAQSKGGGLLVGVESRKARIELVEWRAEECVCLGRGGLVFLESESEGVLVMSDVACVDVVSELGGQLLYAVDRFAVELSAVEVSHAQVLSHFSSIIEVKHVDLVLSDCRFHDLNNVALLHHQFGTLRIQHSSLQDLHYYALPDDQLPLALLTLDSLTDVHLTQFTLNHIHKKLIPNSFSLLTATHSRVHLQDNHWADIQVIATLTPLIHLQDSQTTILSLTLLDLQLHNVRDLIFLYQVQAHIQIQAIHFQNVFFEADSRLQLLRIQECHTIQLQDL